MVMAHSRNFRVEKKRVAILDVQDAVLVQEDTTVCLYVSLSKPHLSLSDRLRKVLQGPAGRKKRNGGLKPFKNLRLEELREECQARGLPTDGQKTDLQEILKEEMGRIQRAPAMMFFNLIRTRHWKRSIWVRDNLFCPMKKIATSNLKKTFEPKAWCISLVDCSNCVNLQTGEMVE